MTFQRQVTVRINDVYNLVTNKILCETLIEKLVPPVILNFCNLHSQKNRKISNNVNTKKKKVVEIKLTVNEKCF
jgi:hypothetical protein